MRVIDTSAWIEWLIGSALGKRVAIEIPDREDCVVPTIVQLELAKWMTRELDENRADQMIAYTQKCVVASLDTRIALHAADLHRQFRLATADAIVYATAREYGAELLTCDAHFEKLAGVILLKKVTAGGDIHFARALNSPSGA